MAAQTGSDRRAFLGGTLAAGAACFGAGLKEALAQAKAAGKPLLTVDNLNSLIDTHHRKGSDAYHALLATSKGNHIGFLQTHFHVTDRQMEELKGFSPIQLETLDFLMELARKHGKKLQFAILPPIGPPPRAVSLESSSGDHLQHKVVRASAKREELLAREIGAIVDDIIGLFHGRKS
jgi:hypothetical protein